MDDTPSDPVHPRPDLAAALRVARAEEAGHADVVVNLRTMAMARLAVLRDALEPVLAQMPAGVDLFDVGLMPGDPPRLFIDMIAFVEMARDRRGFRIFQDRRDGRILLADAATLDAAVDAVTAYMARRLIERDKALAALDPGAVGSMPLRPAVRPGRILPRPTVAPDASGPWFRRLGAAWAVGWAELRERDPLYILGQVFWFAVEVLGLLTLFGLVFFGLRAILFTASVALLGQT